MKKSISDFVVFTLIIALSFCFFPMHSECAEQEKNGETGYSDYVAALGEVSSGNDIIIPATHFSEQSNSDVYANGESLIWNSESGEVTWNFNAEKDGIYAIKLDYTAIKGKNSNIEIGFKINGKYPYDEAKRLALPRVWKDSAKPVTDEKGNQRVSEQEESFDRQSRRLYDINGNIRNELCIFLAKGQNSVTILAFNEPFELHSITFTAPEKYLSYKEWKERKLTGKYSLYSGDEIVIEGENAYAKSEQYLIGQSDNTDPAVTPYDPYKRLINYIGGSNWSQANETIEWSVSAPHTGIYKLGIRYKQNFVLNGFSYRTLRVNGEVPYDELESIGFKYAGKWNFLSSTESGDILVFLNEGENKISLTVTIGKLAVFNEKMQEVVYRLGEIYRDIIMIIGDNADANRDYDLFERVPDLEERMLSLNDSMEELIKIQSEDFKDINDSVSILKKAIAVQQRMLEHKYEAQRYKSEFYDAYSGLSSNLEEIKNMALSIDSLVLGAPKKEFTRRTSGFFGRMMHSTKRLIASFAEDYESKDSKDGLTVWVNWSRDQAQVLDSLIRESFIPKSGIKVTVRITNATLLQGVLSGNPPDCALSVARVMPINLAMRGALADLTQFENYAGVSERFANNADLPYRYNGKVYGIPSTQQFNMLFYRTDIFRQLGLEIPRTWDEFVKVSSILMLNNLEVGLPYVELTNIAQTDNGVSALSIFPTLLNQYGLSLYNKELTATTLTDRNVINVFEKWTDFHTLYRLPTVYNFFNRFRAGLMPMAIQNYSQYATISAAAPELSGRWAMVEIPGVMTSDGTINNSQTGSGTACVILEQSKHKDEAWNFLDWWTSDEIQYRYAFNIESILGVSGRYTSANKNSVEKLGWDTESCNRLMNQWRNVTELPEVPGGYYVSRSIDQAFWNVVSSNKNPIDSMAKWGKIADDEIAKKITQYERSN